MSDLKSRIKRLRKEGTISAPDEARILRAIERVEEAKPVIFDIPGEGKSLFDSDDAAKCPRCGFSYEESDPIWEEPHCPHCGQALSWESEDK